MKLTYLEFVEIIIDKLKRDGGLSRHTMLNKREMKLWLSTEGNGIITSNYSSLNCKFMVLYDILTKAAELGGEMYLGANAAQNGCKIGSAELPVDTIDGFISVKWYGKHIGESTQRRSTYYAYVLEWAGFVVDHRGGYITVKTEFMQE